MNGEPYEIHVSAGAEVRKGEVIGTFNIDAIEKAGYLTITPVIVTNMVKFPNVIPDLGQKEVTETIMKI